MIKISNPSYLMKIHFYFACQKVQSKETKTDNGKTDTKNQHSKTKLFPTLNHSTPKPLFEFVQFFWILHKNQFRIFYLI